MGVKTEVASSYSSGGTTGVATMALLYPSPNSSTGSKFLQWIEVAGTGVITAVVRATPENGIPPGLHGQTFTLTPQQPLAGAYVALTDGGDGRVDWACASRTHVIAAARGMLYTDGTLEPKYLPAECR
jgi:type IV pilus assembly protein PilA